MNPTIDRDDAWRVATAPVGTVGGKLMDDRQKIRWQSRGTYDVEGRCESLGSDRIRIYKTSWAKGRFVISFGGAEIEKMPPSDFTENETVYQRAKARAQELVPQWVAERVAGIEARKIEQQKALEAHELLKRNVTKIVTALEARGIKVGVFREGTTFTVSHEQWAQLLGIELEGQS